MKGDKRSSPPKTPPGREVIVATARAPRRRPAGIFNRHRDRRALGPGNATASSSHASPARMERLMREVAAQGQAPTPHATTPGQLQHAAQPGFVLGLNITQNDPVTDHAVDTSSSSSAPTTTLASLEVATTEGHRTSTTTTTSSSSSSSSSSHLTSTTTGGGVTAELSVLEVRSNNITAGGPVSTITVNQEPTPHTSSLTLDVATPTTEPAVVQSIPPASGAPVAQAAHPVRPAPAESPNCQTTPCQGSSHGQSQA